MDFIKRAIGYLIPLLTLFFGLSCTSGTENFLDADREAAVSEQFMVTSAESLATETGLEILRRGGTAVDAAVAVQMMLSFTEPPESGLGGGAFMIIYDAERNEMIALDGRETAPSAARSNRFTMLGLPLPLIVAAPTGRATGVPGTPALMYEAHQRYGKMDWAELLQPAIDASAGGVPYPPRLKRQIAQDYSLQLFGDLRPAFVYPLREEQPILRNEALSLSLEKLARQGPSVFYEGELGEAIVKRARSRWPMGSDLTAADLADYSVIERELICGEYRSYRICGMPPPSSGGITVLQILGMLQHFDMSALEPVSAEAIHLIAEASRLAFADRFQFIGDPVFTDVPATELIDKEYLKLRSGLIRPDAAMADAPPGNPLEKVPQTETEIPVEEESDGTSHFSVADSYGNWVSVTTTIESPFGSRAMTNGFILNNQLTDFTFRPNWEGGLHPNAVEPGKRPRSSMAPFFVFDETGELVMTVGSRGGGRIIGYVVKALLGVIDWNLDLQQAAALPNVLHMGRFLEIEEGTEAAMLAPELRSFGHDVRISRLESGIHGIQRLPDGLGWRGAADPRMEGLAAGD
ncbi:MAG: gamma-glutamyltransferase [Balneolales bacterium]|nr:gamma-glutamyltransferase [Balneolales bacterium]